jgi:hypothetical protein
MEGAIRLREGNRDRSDDFLQFPPLERSRSGSTGMISGLAPPLQNMCICSLCIEEGASVVKGLLRDQDGPLECLSFCLADRITNAICSTH